MRNALPYDVRPQLGQTTHPVLDAFAERGGTAPQIVSVTMDGGTWRLTELQAGTAFAVTRPTAITPATATPAATAWW
jgi:molecular chaperone DnaK (HSP70)